MRLSFLFLTLAASGTAYCAMGAAAAPNPATNASPTRPAVKISLAILPVFSNASAELDVRDASDKDGYGAIQATPGALGPAALLRDWAQRSDTVSPVLAGGQPAEEVAPLQLHTVLLSFEHRRSASEPEQWEAHVDLGLRVTDTRRDAELWSGYYSAVAPARGPLPASVRQRLFANGLGPYLNLPLGRAFQQAAQEALFGITPPSAPAAPNKTRSPEESSAPSAMLPALSKLLWEAHLMDLPGGGYRITAGEANGLRVGDLLTPYLEAANQQSGSAPARKRVPGYLRVRSMTPHTAIVEDLPGEGIPIGSRASGVYVGRARAEGFDLSFVQGTDTPLRFLEILNDKLNYLETSSNGVWRKHSLFALATGRRIEGRLEVKVEFQVEKTRQLITTWQGTVRPEDAAANAEECARAAWPAIMAHGNPGNSFKLAATATPDAFNRTLETALGTYIHLSQGVWSADTLRLTVSGIPSGMGTTILARLEDTRSTNPLQIGEWKASVVRGEEEVQALECFHTLKSKLQEASGKNQGERDPTGLVAGSVAQNGPAGSMERLFQNRKQELRLWLRFAPDVELPTGTQFKKGQVIKFLLRAGSDCWVLAFNYDCTRRINALWEGFKPIRLRKGEARVIEAPVFGDLGQEYIVALAWEDETPALQVASNLHSQKLASLAGVSEETRSLGYKLSVKPDPHPLSEPSAQAVTLPTLDQIRQTAAQIAKSENRSYAMTWLQFHTGE